MKFYESIAFYYDDIFPYNPVQKNFITASVTPSGDEMNILDIGCGTGNLALELSNDYGRVVGIDLDREMINRARAKTQGKAGNIRFLRLDMLDIGSRFNPHYFDGIICFGNTLVHLDGINEIELFLDRARLILKPGGKLLIQVVNYDRILKKNIRSLPLIENEKLRFERYYQYDRATGKIIFRSKLTINENGQVIENRTELFPIKKNEMELVLRNAGFGKISFYGGFNRDIFTEDSIPLVVKAR